jgi:hypothetical protein
MYTIQQGIILPYDIYLIDDRGVGGSIVNRQSNCHSSKQPIAINSEYGTKEDFLPFRTTRIGRSRPDSADT